MKLDHLPHLEDLLFSMPLPELGEYLTELFEESTASNKASRKLTIKYDGSPSLIVGIDPADGKFYVATKGLFNKKPLLYKSMDELSQITNVGLRHVLQTAYTQFKPYSYELPCAMQGDVMWVTGDLRWHVDGLFCGTNVLSYRINDFVLEHLRLPPSIGVVWHTTYSHSGSLSQLDVTDFVEPDFPSWAHQESMHLFPFLWTTIAMSSVVGRFHAEVLEMIARYGDLTFSPQERVLFPKHFPNCVGDHPRYCSFSESVHESYKNQISKFKTARKRDELNLECFDILQTACRNPAHVRAAAALWDAIRRFKLAILGKYTDAGVLTPYTYDVDSDTYTPAKHEGLVFRTNDVMSKLVDRDYFSTLNKNSPYSKQSRSNK